MQQNIYVVSQNCLPLLFWSKNSFGPDRTHTLSKLKRMRKMFRFHKDIRVKVCVLVDYANKVINSNARHLYTSTYH